MGNNTSDEDSFGDAMPNAASELPSAIDSRLTLSHHDSGKRIAEGRPDGNGNGDAGE